MSISPSLLSEERPSPMDKFSWLLGNRTFEDEQVNGAYWEKGTRNCFLVLHDQYIRCESIGVSNKGKERSYHFILVYNTMDKRYEMLGLTSSYPRQNLYIIEPSEDGLTLEIRNLFWTEEGVKPSNEASIKYNGKDKYLGIFAMVTPTRKQDRKRWVLLTQSLV